MVLKELSLNVIGDSNDQTNFPHKLLLTDAQIFRFRKAFANDSSANIKFSKTLSKMVELGGFLLSVFLFLTNQEKLPKKMNKNLLENKGPIISVLDEANKTKKLWQAM